MPKSVALPPELHQILSSKKLRDDLISYASQNFCEENVLFLEEVLDLKQRQNPRQVSQIVDKYIRPDSPCQVNIDSALQQKILESTKKVDLFDPDFSVFDEAFVQVSDLVLNDTVSKMQRNPSSSSFFNKARQSADKTNTSISRVSKEDGEMRNWFRGHLLRRQGFFQLWKAYTYMKKGSYLFEFKAGANHLKSSPLLTIPLEGSLVETARTITGKDFSFILHTRGGQSYFFRASSTEEMEEWMAELSEASSFKMRTSKSMSTSPSVQTGLTSPPAYAPPSYTSSAVPAPAPEVGHGADVDLVELSKAMPILNFLESFTDAVVVSDAAGLVVATNSAMERMFGYSKKELKGFPLNNLMPEPYRSRHDGYMFRHEKFGDERLIGKIRNLTAVKKGEVPFEMQISLGKLPIKGFFIATIRER